MGDDGLATGEMLEAAGSLVEDLIPVPTEEEDARFAGACGEDGGGIWTDERAQYERRHQGSACVSKLGGTRRNVLACVCAVSSGA